MCPSDDDQIPIPEPAPPRPGLRQRIARALEDARQGYRATPGMQRFFWQGRLKPAFWTIASLISLVVNVVLIVVVLLLARQVFFLKNVVAERLVGGLYDNFALMKEAHIQTTVRVDTTIQVQDQMPVVFDLPLKQNTSVILVEQTPIDGVSIYLNGVWIPTNIILPQGARLPIQLDLTVPVSTTVPVDLSVPVSLSVPVDIALADTELYTPFVGLQEVVAPYQVLLAAAPDSPEDVGICQTWWAGWACSLLFDNP